MIKPGVYTGVVTARSSSEPGRDHTYTVSVQTPDGAIEFTNAAPQSSARWSSVDDTIQLVPFPLSRVVSVHLIGSSDNLVAIIADGELPFMGPCPPPGGAG